MVQLILYMQCTSLYLCTVAFYYIQYVHLIHNFQITDKGLHTFVRPLNPGLRVHKQHCVTCLKRLLTFSTQNKMAFISLGLAAVTPQTTGALAQPATQTLYAHTNGLSATNSIPLLCLQTVYSRVDGT